MSQMSVSCVNLTTSRSHMLKWSLTQLGYNRELKQYTLMNKTYLESNKYCHCVLICIYVKLT